ncbi:MAG: hypothetical protein ACKO2O_07970 [Crocinitomicaceae bacterium]
MDNKSPNDDAIFHLISGSYLARIGAFKQSIDHLNQAKLYFLQLQDFELLTKILNEMGICFHLSGNRQEATYYYEQSMLCGKKADDELLSILAEINLAKLFIEDEKYVTAVARLQHYICISKKYEKFEALSNAYAALVDLYLRKEDIPFALKYAKELQFVAGRTNNQNIMLRALTNQAVLAFYNEENDKAEDLFHQILHLRKQQNHPLKLSDAYFNLAGYYIDFNIETAKKYLDTAYKIAIDNHAYSLQEDILLFKQKELNDSLATEEIKTLRRIIEKERKVLLKSLETMQNEAIERKTSRHFLLISTLITVILGLVIFGSIKRFFK